MESNAAIITINENGIIQSVDKSCCFLFGYEFLELIGNNVTILIPSPYKEQHNSYLTSYHSTGVAGIIGKTRIVEALHKNGNSFPIRLSITEIKSPNARFYIATIDKLEDRAAVVTASLEGVIISCNQNCEEIFGYKVNEILNKNVSMLMPPPHSKNHDQYIENYKKTGIQKVIGHVRNVPAKHKNGTVFPICLQVNKVKIGEMELLRATIDRINLDIEAMFTLDESGVIESTNRNFILSLFGYENNELVGKNISFLIPQIHVTANEMEENKEKKRKTEIDWKEKLESRIVDVKHKDGSFFQVYLEVKKFATEKNEIKYSGRIKRAPDNPLELQDFSSDDEVLLKHKKANTGSMENYIGEYQLGEIIGKGAFGIVKVAHNKATGQKVAIKILQRDIMESSKVERALKEIEILRKLSHPHVVKLLDVILTDDRIYLIMEYVTGGELFEYVKHNSKLTESRARGIFLQIIDTLIYFHSINIIHRDINMKNILLDENLNIKIIDFGLSNFISEGLLHSTFCGTPAFAAPEMILGKKYSGPEVDVWSAGVVLYVLVSGKYPFSSISELINGTFIMPDFLSKSLSDLILSILVVDHVQRISLEKIRQHQWFTL